jgi:hypothetical protein
VIDAGSLLPGTVIVTATKDRWAKWLRLRSRIMGRPALHNHVALVSHRDETGRWRGLEGRPSGFGWCNLDKYLEHPDSISNATQPLSDGQRQFIVEQAQQMVGMPYDWRAILCFALTTVGLPFLAEEWPEDGVPSQNVCSSSVDMLYEAVGAPNPGGFRKTRGTDPDDWTDFILSRAWA